MGDHSGQTLPEPNDPSDLELYKRLVDLQEQIVQISRQNARAEQECLTLRKAIEQRAESATPKDSAAPRRRRLFWPGAREIKQIFGWDKPPEGSTSA